jgi:glyceraldehyde 3-phosphate dehydrogenase
MTFLTEKSTSVEELNNILSEEAETEKYKNVFGVTTEPLVSSDIVGTSYASLADLEMTRVVDGNLIKIMAWYDNEWGFTNQMVRTAVRIAKERNF